MPVEYDEIGIWSELKLEIVKRYAKEYSKILTSKKKSNARFRHIYVDAFAGPGVHLSKATGEWVAGSPLNALELEPPFDEIHLIDASEDRTAQLLALAGKRKNVYVYSGDCNEILVSHVFPRVQWGDYHRALCFLDPYGIDLSWDVVKQAGQMGSVEIFLNFMIMDANMNALRRDPSSVDPVQAARMTRFWGDETWRDAAWQPSGQRNLFSDAEDQEKAPNEAIVEAYRQRLLTVAGFKYVPAPIAMHTKRGATIYYLYFASPKAPADTIVSHIFDKFRPIA